MGRGRLAAVTDAGPLIHLTEIGCLHLLSIFGNLHVPEAVWAETVERGRTSSEDFLKLSNVERHNIPQNDITWFVEKYNLKDLHSGECECLYLCKQIDVPILLTDDLAVRGAAKRLKLVPVGSLGIVAKAYRLGKISMADAQHHILNLYEVSSLFVTKVIAEVPLNSCRTPYLHKLLSTCHTRFESAFKVTRLSQNQPPSFRPVYPNVAKAEGAASPSLSPPGAGR